MLLTKVDRLKETRRKIDHQIRNLFLGVIEEGDEVTGVRWPKRLGGPTVLDKHEDYLRAVRTNMGIVETVEEDPVRKTTQDVRKKWKEGYRNQVAA